MNILITGANGMIGRAAMKRSRARGWSTCAALRRPSALFTQSEARVVGEIGESTDWSSALEGVDGVIHIAGLAHTENVSLGEIQRVNVLGAARLAESCAVSGVRRLVLLSTAKVHGSKSDGRPFIDADPPSPVDAYAISKWEGEHAVRHALAGSDVQVTVVRSPLVYGPNVRANFLSLLKLVDSGLPLPLANIRNERSIIFVDNLADLLAECVSSPVAQGETFLASEGPPISTPELIKLVARELGKPARLFGVAPRLLETLARITGQSRITKRLVSSFAVDGTRAHRLLSWSPPSTLSSGLAETASWYVSASRKSSGRSSRG